MSPTKEHQSNEDLKTFKEEVIQQFHIISENVIDQVKQVAEGVRNVDEKIERFRKEIKAEVAENHAALSLAIKKVDEKIDNTRQELKAEIQGIRTELKTEIQETRQEILAAVKFSYAELDRRLTILEKEFLELRHRVDKIEGRSIS